MPVRGAVYDLVIVGASFAGLVAARTAAARGLKVAVVEAKYEPGARVRTTGLLVKEAADLIDIPSHLVRKIRGVRLYSPKGRTSDFFAPGYYFLATNTAALLRWLAREAERAGARFFFGTKFTAGERVDGLIRLDQPRLVSRYLIGADGVRSRVARAFGLGQVGHTLTGLEYEFEPWASLDSRFLHTIADSQLAPGYLAWAVPGVGVTQVGLAVRGGVRPDGDAVLARFRDLIGEADARPLSQRAGILPASGLVRPFSGSQVLLVGDAAGLCSPATGGGIKLAFEFGRLAAIAVCDHLADRGPDPGRVMAASYPRFRAKSLLRAALDIAPSNALIEALLFTPPLKALAQRAYFHRRGGSAEDWRALQAELSAPLEPALS